MPDSDKAVRDFLRGRAAVTALVDAGRIDFAAVSDTSAPSVRVTRVGGGDDTSDAPLDRPLVQIDVWSGSNPSRNQAAALKGAIRDELHRFRTSAMNADVIGHGAVLQSDIYVPDNDFTPPRPRYSLTYELVTVAVAT